jgi:ankyrin repeat protein
LQFSARFGLEECAKLLLLHGADPFVADRHGKSAAQYALEHKHDNLHRVLLNYATIERVRAQESEGAATGAILRKQRGLLSASWSQPRT